MPVYKKRIKRITLTVGGQSWECQTEACELENNTDDPDKGYTLCEDGEYLDDVDPDYALTFTALADWRANGLSRYLWEHDGQLAAFEYVLHPEDPTASATFSGQVQLKAPNAGGEARTTEKQEITLQILGKPEGP